ncbi:MAG: IgGFc-binding protein [Myxococcota bacterium]
MRREASQPVDEMASGLHPDSVRPYLRLGLASVLCGLGCGGDPAPFVPGTDAAPPEICTGTGIECLGDVAHTCEDGETTSTEDCAEEGRQCVAGRGCLLCTPGSVECDGETLMTCTADGLSREAGETCDRDAGLRCSPTGCADLCAEAEASNSYIGCEYWPTPVINSQLPDEFEFAVVVANPNLVPARVSVERGDATIAALTIEPGELDTIRLPWIDALKGISNEQRSEQVADGSYRLSSDVPVTVQQFNPLEFRIDQDCANEMDSDGRCFSFTNDASLLLPTPTLTGSYLGLARPTMLLEINGEGGPNRLGSPGFLAITATEDGTQVEVRSSAFTQASSDGLTAALSPGETVNVELDRGDVFQLVSGIPTDCPAPWEVESSTEAIRYCPLGDDYDLTGSEIRASAPVAVIGGHDCSFVPFNRWACDHLEEALFPVEAWGRDVLVASTEPLRREPNFIRVVSSSDGNEITFEPDVRAPLSLNRGDHVELPLTTQTRVRGTGPLSVVQFLVGQDFSGLGNAGNFAAGDPSMSIAIPTEQLRTEYTFLAPATYDQSWINVTAPMAARVLLDGRLVQGLEPIGDTGAGVARIEIRPGVHRMEGTQPFGVVVYGFGSYTSYMVPGGLDLREIAPPI